jgi:hypothetical protein
MSNSLEDGYSIEGLIYQDTVEVAESQIELIFTHQNREKVGTKENIFYAPKFFLLYHR